MAIQKNDAGGLETTVGKAQKYRGVHNEVVNLNGGQSVMSLPTPADDKSLYVKIFKAYGMPHAFKFLFLEGTKDQNGVPYLDADLKEVSLNRIYRIRDGDTVLYMDLVRD
ncbi:hypothetical protein HYX03_02255 [Candidatus Woesearchaeota archaeon]|nr:hypothetical protein [Candidatus Woesearchaeota archaeon]